MATQVKRSLPHASSRPKPLGHRLRIPKAQTNEGFGVLGLKGQSAAALVQRINDGFPYPMVDVFKQSTGLSMEAIADVMRVPSRTLNRRKQEGRLRPDESEHLLRAARVFDKAVELFEGDAAAAMRWLQSPQPALARAKPLDFARTEVGAREVEDLIGRLEHGVLS